MNTDVWCQVLHTEDPTTLSMNSNGAAVIELNIVKGIQMKGSFFFFFLLIFIFYMFLCPTKRNKEPELPYSLEVECKLLQRLTYSQLDYNKHSFWEKTYLSVRFFKILFINI